MSTVGDLAELRELTVVADGDHHLTVPGIEDLIRNNVRVSVALALRRLTRNEVIQVHVGHRGDLNIEQCHVDVLPLPVVARCVMAARMATVEYMPVMISANATPTFC